MADQEETPKPCWSNVVKTQTPAAPTPISGESLAEVVVGSCKSTKGIAVAVVDANAIIYGGESLSQCAEKFVSVPEVMDEVRDPVSRHRLAIVPFDIQIMEPSPESLSKVMKFARSTGDLQTLSEVDLKLIALTYTLEAQIHGTEHLRDRPPPIQTVNVRRLPEKDLPGWGSNVPNLEEWEALEEQEEETLNRVSRILPSKDLNLNAVSDSRPEEKDVFDGDRPVELAKYGGSKKKEVNIQGKKMVAEGVDASKGEFGEGDDGGDWMPAVSRSTHRRFLRRKARREQSESLSEKNDAVAEVEEVEPEVCEGLDNLEISSEVNDEDDVDCDDVSEQSLNLRALSESTVACITSDFAMQNVILQMGLRLVATGGMQIRQLQRWVLRCHACYTVTPEVGKIFCPKCGNGGTLHKVAVTVGENGITLAARRPRVTLRGTKYSLPKPQGGRDAVTKNLILREDQLPQKYLNPKTKKKVVKKEEGDDFFIRETESIFGQHHDDKRGYQPPVRKSLAVFSGKRNPNDNHYSRVMHK